MLNLGTQSHSSDEPRICMLTLRNFKEEVSRCHPYEFEDVVCEIDDVFLMAPNLSFSPSVMRKVRKLANRFSGTPAPLDIEICRVERDFDVFFMACQCIHDIKFLRAVEGWKKHSRVSVCWVEEIWACNVEKLKDYLKILSEFDLVVLNCRDSVRPVQEMVRGSCSFMPTAIDTIRFCPYPDLPARSIDVYSLGRRSSTLHQALLKLSDQKHIFYIYDTLKDMIVRDHRQHRDMIANIAKRSRYFLVNPPKFDELSYTNGQCEIGYRFFEGAASGTVMIGKSPQTEVFKQHFNWRDAVIELPYGKDIDDVLSDLNSEPERLEEIRKNNVVQSLLRHDWAYRWKAVLDMIGLEPMPALIERQRRLRKLAEIAATADLKV